MNKNKIKGVGLDCSTLSYRPADWILPDNLYYDTSSNNFQCIKGLTEGKNLIIRVGTAKEGLIQILEGLGLDRPIDILLLPTSKIDPTLLKEALDKFDIKNVGIDRPESLTQLGEAAELIKSVIIPTYISLNLCPLYFQKEIIDWAEENEVRVLGFNPFGGFVSSSSIIESFSVPFLLNFSAAYSEVVFLSGRDPYNATNYQDYLLSLVGEDRMESDMVEIEKSVNHLVKPLPQLVYMGLKMSDGSIIPISNPDSIFNPGELVFGSEEIMWEDKTENLDTDDIIKSILEFNLFSLPISKDYDKPTNLSIILPSIMKELKKTGSEVEMMKLGDQTFLIKVEKTFREMRYVWWDKVWKEKSYYILHMNEEGEMKVKFWK